MDHEVICDCTFLDRCETYRDGLIDASRKGPAGFGCCGRNDQYRARHCRAFACAYLSLVLHDALHGGGRTAHG